MLARRILEGGRTACPPMLGSFRCRSADRRFSIRLVSTISTRSRPTSPSSACRLATRTTWRDRPRRPAPPRPRCASSRSVGPPISATTTMTSAGTSSPAATVRIIDCGDVGMTPGRFRRQQPPPPPPVINAILDRGAVPIVLGGDHAIPIPVFRAYEGRGPMVIVQLDQHIDWRDERNGVTQGLSSTMRRASEMPWVKRHGPDRLRAVGSARQGRGR